MRVSVEQAYAACETIARREAKNFYYSFLALPRHKRAAMCAVYAFMRHADDLADDENLPLLERRKQMEAWIGAWHKAANGGATDNPVFIAVRDVQQKFQIPTELLDQLIQGTMMDLVPSADNNAVIDAPIEYAFTTYRTFDDLYRYCYYVASVVGLVCIRIFGYNDPRAEILAEQTGIAFQLTNILRDVKEDVLRRRVYLPLEDLDRYSLSIEQLENIPENRPLTLDERSLLEMESHRAFEYYTSADALLPMISADSRPALWVLVTVYRRLLHRIVASNYQVFSVKIKVPTYEKIAILLCGLWMVMRIRLFSSA